MLKGLMLTKGYNSGVVAYNALIYGFCKTGVKVLQQAIVHLLLDIMVKCCQPSERKKCNDASKRSISILDNNGTATNRTVVELRGKNGTLESLNNPVDQRLDVGMDGASSAKH